MTSANSLAARIATAIANGELACVDLSNVLSPDFPVIALPEAFGQCAPFRMEPVSRYDDNGPAWYWNNISMNEHTGTHFDAPVHWVTGRDLPRNTVDKIEAKDFVAPAVVIDIGREADANADFVVTRAFLEDWERANGVIPPRHWIALRTDWYKRVGTPGYMNLQEDGAHSPGPDATAMEFLVHERDCIGLAVETVGTDAGQAYRFDPPLPAHSILHGNGRFGLQCLTNLDKLPTFGAVIVAAPMKIQNGSGSPLRVFAMYDAAAG